MALSKLSGDEQCVIFSSSCATCSTRASVDRVAIRWIGVYMNRERKGCHIHSELVRAFSLWYAPVPGCDKFRLVLPMSPVVMLTKFKSFPDHSSTLLLSREGYLELMWPSG